MLRDNIILNARTEVERADLGGGRVPLTSGRGDQYSRDEMSPMARELSIILNDNRIVSIEVIVKNSSSLPPILFSPNKRARAGGN